MELSRQRTAQQEELKHLTATLEKFKPRVSLVHKKWQDVLAVDVTGNHASARLVWLDPPAQPAPAASDKNTLRALLDKISSDATVVLIFGNYRTLVEQWIPIFAPGLMESTVAWHVETKLMTIERRLREVSIQEPSKASMWQSMSDTILTAVRRPARGKGAGAGAVPDTRHYSAELKKKYGSHNGGPCVVVHDYEPPANGTRLRARDGTELRGLGEKTPKLCEYFLDLYTAPDELVVDFFSGSATMAMACVKMNRKYFGCDSNASVHTAAFMRLAKVMELQTRPEFARSLAIPGYDTVLAKQVFSLSIGNFISRRSTVVVFCCRKTMFPLTKLATRFCQGILASTSVYLMVSRIP